MKKVLLLILIVVPAIVMANNQISFLTINVWSGLTYEGKLKVQTYESRDQRAFRYGLLVNEIKKLDPDVISINEANMLPGYARRLARDLDYDYLFAVGLGGIRLGPVGFPTNLREGNVILAKKFLNLSVVGNRKLSGGYAGNFASFHLGDSTQAICGKITVGEQAVYVFATQWHSSYFSDRATLKELVDLYQEDRLPGQEYLHRVQDAIEGQSIRMVEAATLLEFVNQTAGEGSAVMLGDFNALPDSAEIGMILESGFSDCWNIVPSRNPGYTRDELQNSNIKSFQRQENEPSAPRRDRIDYIFYKGENVAVKSAGVVLNDETYEIHPSDHFGVLAVIQF